MSRVLIVGAGLTGSLCACLLRRELADRVQIVVWEKSRGAGGRMSTSRSPSNMSCTADLGAQYITSTPYYSKIHKSFYEELLQHDILKPLEATMEGMMLKDEASINYVTPSGMSSIVKHYLRESAGAEVFFGHHVTHVSRRGSGWEVCRKEGVPEQFDVVVLTMPVPQILQLQGDIGSLLKDSERQKLEAVSYSSRFALGLFYKAGVQISVPWAAKYVSNNPCIRYIAIDDKKRNLVSDKFGPSVVVHTSVPFGLQHVEKTLEEMQPVILQELQKLMPELPEPENIKCQKWRYSQVTGSVADCPGQITLLSEPLLVCGGDAFTHSNFDGCVESALKVFQVLKSSL
ncbi:renalase isoform X1 [Astyanax mexicanus]|uniref:Renalase, FAD-dependent amine oxidase n=1 Tax=Astyanax mexicanus TaxID=7994 RepID=A0A8B9HB58_ASTMX|nr:renalase isoform X1 [Astyanax mexicanus]